MAPYDLSTWSDVTYFLVFFLIGAGFGATLEMAGFGDSRKLAAQFYLKEMTVLKVMFTGIVVAATLIFLSTSLGLLDFSRVFVNPTYLWPGIVGGLIMGVGFIIGGFCPGTSLVAASTMKIDGMVFALGVTLGTFVFGEWVGSIDAFWHSSYYGRFTMMDWLGVDAGVVLVGLILMALFAFFLGEISESVFGDKPRPSGSLWRFSNRRHVTAAGALVLVGLVVLLIGQPSLEKRWEQLQPKAGETLESRAVYVHPAEVVAFRGNPGVYVTTLDVRPEAYFNLFHLQGAVRLEPGTAGDPALIKRLKKQPTNTATFIISNGEQWATEAYRELYAAGVPNIYVVEGGYNNWLSKYQSTPCLANAAPELRKADEELGFRFLRAVGGRAYNAHPECGCKEVIPYECDKQNPNIEGKGHRPVWPKYTYDAKVKIRAKAKVTGGCG